LFLQDWHGESRIAALTGWIAVIPDARK